MVSESQILGIGSVLKDPKRPLKERFRALFTLKNIGGSLSIKCIKEAFVDSSVLLKHELAYCLGQMQDKQAISVLINVLEDVKQEPMVRHEAAEALGAIGSQDTIDYLEKYKTDPVIEVAETCQLAIERLKWLANPDNSNSSPFNSVDPAPPLNDTNLNELKSVLLDENRCLFDRYRAMFALRNLGGKEAIHILGLGLKGGSALFRHEIAFVLGQMQDKSSVEFLRDSLENCEENEMVRHECAEALGAIATQDCWEILNRFLKDDKRVVRESCEIALDMCEYENSPEFQYANTLSVVS